MKKKKSIKRYLFERENHRCWFCNKELKFRQISLDHYLPKSAQGPEEIFNYVLSCKGCNKLKRNQIPDDYPEIWISLFQKAFKDKKISISDAKLEFTNVAQIIAGINRLEALNDYVVLQSANYRIYVQNNKIKKIIQIGSMPD